jgi:thiol-disulfide isomerase/thioredoxin
MAILFWATWCPHSRGAIADYESLAQKYGGRRGLEFYAVSLDPNENFEVLRERIQNQSLTSMVHVFSGNDTQDEAFLSLRGARLPYAVFVDDHAIVRYVGIGLGGLESFIADRYGH